MRLGILIGVATWMAAAPATAATIVIDAQDLAEAGVRAASPNSPVSSDMVNEHFRYFSQRGLSASFVTYEADGSRAFCDRSGAQRICSPDAEIFGTFRRGSVLPLFTNFIQIRATGDVSNARLLVGKFGLTKAVATADSDGVFTIRTDLNSIASFTLQNIPGRPSLGPLEVRSISFNTLVRADVPEPATWSLMILGFATIGGGMRLRQPNRAIVRLN